MLALPEEVDLIGAVRRAKELMLKYVGRELPMIGTEAGNNVTGENNAKWLRKAWSDIHQNLILLGEGFWFNVGFHGVDMGRESGVNTWGYSFNLDPERDYGAQKTSPKPALPAYTAMSWLLEGKQLTIPTSLPHNKPPTEYRRMGQSTHVPVVQSGEQ